MEEMIPKLTTAHIFVAFMGWFKTQELVEAFVHLYTNH